MAGTCRIHSQSAHPLLNHTNPNRPWGAHVSPHLSENGKRERKFFETEKEAKAECETLKARRDNFGISLTAMTPARIAESVEAYKLLHPLSVNLLDAVRGYIQRHTERTSSRPWKEVFEEY